MILIDMSHLAISNILSDYKSFKGEIDPNLFKHMILTSLSNYKQKFEGEFGELVICCDSKTPSWRKQKFQHYKANRKKDDSFIDWAALYKILDSMIEDLKTYFPYKVIHVNGAEGDDCIAVLAQTCSRLQKDCVVVSNDKDFNQLLKYPRVKVYSTKNKAFVTKADPQAELLEHVIGGDSGDGIPNILSIEESFVAGRRQSPVKKAKMREEWIPSILGQLQTGFVGTWPAEWDDDAQKRFKQNLELIDFDYIPKEISSVILDQYQNNPIIGSKQMIMRYFMENRMKNLLRDIGKF